MKKKVEDYKDLLRSSRVKIVGGDTWDVAVGKLQGHKAFEALGDEEMKKKIFEECLERMSKRKREDGEESDGEEREEKRRKVEE